MVINEGHGDLIFSGEKNIEFRKRKAIDFTTKDKIYLYEVDDKKRGKVIGEASCSDIIYLGQRNRDYIIPYFYMYKQKQENMTFDDFVRFTDLKLLDKDFLRKAKEWGQKIGFLNSDIKWKHVYVLSSPRKYKKPASLAVFLNKYGKNLIHAPQSWCYVSLKPRKSKTQN